MEIKIGNAQFIEVDIYKNITYTNIILVKEPIDKIIRESKLLNIQNQLLVLIQNLKGSYIIIEVQEEQNSSNKQIQKLRDKDLLICNQDISISITEISNQLSKLNSGYILQFQNTTNLKMQVQYIELFEYLDQNMNILQNDNDQQIDYQINQKSIYELNIQVFNYPVSNFSIFDFDQIFKQEQQPEAIVFISDQLYQFQQFSYYKRSNTIMKSSNLVLNCKIIKLKYDSQNKSTTYEIELPNQFLLFKSNYLIRIYLKSNLTQQAFPISQVIQIPQYLLSKRKIVSENQKQKKIILFLLTVSLILVIMGLFIFLLFKQLKKQAEKQI
ncbi:transmembrane protein, putative (macronuclear) [Tetrahymena thermophila SB210]|uniref:Transmembrane protein, putative n=1 Tax=Tetrahymena thermophila (strain SB210) TaxID=312017 RepID=W7XJZ2_TETTS|nr:transmembrane protein, putative [Tetrahymena thermophila SB210]EWS76076.1 transmembrane protein, putative [Tetrahymena thermophila SB210]|eukprot:XP_012651383.1 transmembrane protein, putative [Tetrahymena thermophila SB210]